MKLSLRVLSAAVPCLLILPMSPTAWAAKANPAPRITAAKMVDSDRDDKVDRVVLTWSEPITHARDADRTYPFTVSGYVITSVAAARRSRSLTVLVRERATRDISTHPAVRYVPTARGAVKDNRGKQPVRSVFTRTVALDVDRDRYAAKDCRPTVAAIHPGAADKPDTGLVDTNCDGIDGLRNGPLFVSPLGQDSSNGSITSPLRTFDQAVTNSGGTRDIYVAAGTYSSALTDPVTSSVYGGYSSSWSRSAANPSTLTLTKPLRLGGSPTLQLVRLNAPSTTSDKGTVAVTTEHANARLEKVTITSGPGAAATLLTPARSSIGLWAKSSTVQIVGGSISTGAGGAGAPGVAGADGLDGLDGLDGALGECVLGVLPAAGGAGGTSPVPGHDGGTGGLGGSITDSALAGLLSPDLTPGGAAGLTGLIGGIGQPGGDGAAGAPGTSGHVDDGDFAPEGFLPGDSTDGTDGTSGFGGGGGGGGGAQLTSLLLGSGNGGGGGGAGAAPGLAGTGASGGGGSMAVWADNSSITLTGTRVATAGGGDGGEGGPGGEGGTGGLGGDGGTACPTRVGLGGLGGLGGDGGPGGDGGDGAGGPSLGVARLGTSTVQDNGTVWDIGPAGDSPAGDLHDGLFDDVSPAL